MTDKTSLLPERQLHCLKSYKFHDDLTWLLLETLDASSLIPPQIERRDALRVTNHATTSFIACVVLLVLLVIAYLTIFDRFSVLITATLIFGKSHSHFSNLQYVYLIISTTLFASIVINKVRGRCRDQKSSQKGRHLTGNRSFLAK